MYVYIVAVAEICYICIAMKIEKKQNIAAPKWFVLLLVLFALPILTYPCFLSRVDIAAFAGVDADIMRFMVYAMPVYVVLNQWLSYKVYTDRKTLAWILQALLLVVYAFGLWLVCF